MQAPCLFHLAHYFAIGQAKDTLLQLAQEKQGFDIVFIDSDKPGYKEYYKVCT